MARSNGDKPPVAYVVRGVWPDADIKPDAPPSASAAQQLARTLGAAMAEAATGQRALAAASGVAHTTIGRILAGTVLCHIGSLARLEHALGRRLWPEHADAVTRRRSLGKRDARNHPAV
ncbi:helix-turn-helix transcriptional regulator [Mycobacterium sp.]|uniref:helix-turn-helix transcriptional regulator n=1 Tax=Mycobacterium sp. TaxID=1785 RepID=UPI0031D69853